MYWKSIVRMSVCVHLWIYFDIIFVFLDHFADPMVFVFVLMLKFSHIC